MPKRKVITTVLLVILLSFYKTYGGVTPPVTTATPDPSDPNGNNDWYTVPVTYTIQATDLESGVGSINYKVDENDWVIIPYSDTLNLAPNPSFEQTDLNSPLFTDNWKPTLVDEFSTYSRDISQSKPGFETASVKIESTGALYHSIDHYDSYAVASSFSNMNASAWVKTSNVADSAYFKVYAISDDGAGGQIVTQVGQSNAVTGSTDWVQLSTSFIVSVPDALGVYIEIGLQGTGTIWIDAANINDSLTTTSINLLISTDGEHTLQYFSTDRMGNIEGTHSTSLKIDQTPPGNWVDSGAFRGILGPSDHHLYVYTNVDDDTSGLSFATDIYQYSVDNEDGFGIYSDIMQCSSSWQSEDWEQLMPPTFSEGDNTAYLLTPKTDFCTSNWSICKVVKFYAEDMAGNSSTKALCLNGPWISFTGGGAVKANDGIDMLSEADEDNTDGLIESGNTQIGYFTSSKNWHIKNSGPITDYTYSVLWDMTNNRTEMTGDLPTSDGVYYTNSNLSIGNALIPGDYDTTSFANIIFVNGDLTIITDLEISNNSAVLFIVSGDVKIDKNVENLSCGIFTDGNIYTAYNVEEGKVTKKLNLNGIFSANDFIFNRTLQGTENNDTPSEIFKFEPKYITKISDLLGKNSIQWISGI